MGACAAKPPEATTRAPEEVHVENSTPGSALVTTTPVETTATAEEANKSSETDKEDVEEKPVESSDSKPTTALEEQKYDIVDEKVPGDEPSKENETVEPIPVHEPNKEKETVELVPVDEPNERKEAVEQVPEKEVNNQAQ